MTNLTSHFIEYCKIQYLILGNFMVIRKTLLNELIMQQQQQQNLKKQLTKRKELFKKEIFNFKPKVSNFDFM